VQTVQREWVVISRMHTILHHLHRQLGGARMEAMVPPSLLVPHLPTLLLMVSHPIAPTRHTLNPSTADMVILTLPNQTVSRDPAFIPPIIPHLAIWHRDLLMPNHLRVITLSQLQLNDDYNYAAATGKYMPCAASPPSPLSLLASRTRNGQQRSAHEPLRRSYVLRSSPFPTWHERRCSIVRATWRDQTRREEDLSSFPHKVL